MKTAAPTEFDAVIVGAGPAGCATAIQLAGAGWSVALVERQRFPRRKVCGECIAASNLPLLQMLGVGPAFEARAGAALRQVQLWAGSASVTAELPAAPHARLKWGRALGRESLDGLLLEQARNAGVVVFQPWAVQAIHGKRGAWHCEIRSLESAPALRLDAAMVIDAHGSWEALPSDRAGRRTGRSAADLFAFKANFAETSLHEGVISVLMLDGGYGGMVVADGGMATVACCIRRDRLAALRRQAPGLRAGEAVEAFLRRSCAGVQSALQGAVRDGPWLTSGPLATGVRIDAADDIFRVGNAAGEAHPILGEGLSMALQSSALLCAHLLGGTPASKAPAAQRQAEIQRGYAAAWRRAFVPRMRVAAAFAHLAMRPASAAALMQLVRLWPGLLTEGARWGGKTRFLEPTAVGRASHGGVSLNPSPKESR